MSKNQASPANSGLLPALLGILLAFAGLVYFSGYYKGLTLLAGAGMVYLLLRRDLTPLRSIPVLLFLSYTVISGLSRLWAISGKFFLKEYSEIFVAAALFLAVILCRQFDRYTVRRFMKLMVSASTFYAVLSVEAATTGLSGKLLCTILPYYQSIHNGFESGTRLTGILGNANVLSSVLALGIFCSICLLCAAEDKKTQLFYTGVTAANAYVFLLLFSMGGTACFIAAVLCYLIFAGKNRSGVLIRMLECAIPTLIWVFIAFPAFNQQGDTVILPLCALAGNVITAVVLEAFIGSRITRLLSGHEKLALGVLAGAVVLACTYVVLGLNLTGAYTFGGEALRRSAYPAAGEHTLSIQADAPVQVTVISQDMSEIMMHTETVIYRGSAEDAVFTVPKNSRVCYFTFTAEPGTVLEQAELDTGESLKLSYTLLPGFIANRLQGLFANQNIIQRTVFFRDGMKMFYNSPVVGNGVGSFETGITSVQEFMYTTKYIHNHYIQVLLEVGLVGFLPFAGALLCMVWLLLKRRREDSQWEFSAEYPALWACLVMILTHMAVELSMSIVVFLWMAFVVFALVMRCCAPAPAEEGGTKPVMRLAAVLLPLVFISSLGCNMAMGRMMNRPVPSLDVFFDNLELAASIDPYEANDAKLSYVLQTYNNSLQEQIPQANKYAEELLEYQSNTIPAALLQYYLYTGQYQQSFRAAQAAAVYSASNSDVWNQIVSVMAARFLDDPDSPLFSDRECASALDGLMTYYNTLQERNANSMEAIKLTAVSRDFFSRVLALTHSDLSYKAVADVLYYQLFDSEAFCDADRDLIPDQALAHSGVSFGETWDFQENGSVTLELLSRDSYYPASVTIECEHPEAVTVTDQSGAAIPGTVSGNRWLGQAVQNEMGAPVKLTIRSASPQQITHLSMISE